MSLFFDRQWFDDRLSAIGATEHDVARLLKLSVEQVGEMWKDQRELRTGDVLLLADLLKVEPAEIVVRAGVSTPAPSPPADLGIRLGEINDRLARLERGLAEVKGIVLARGTQSDADSH